MFLLYWYETHRIHRIIFCFLYLSFEAHKYRPYVTLVGGRGLKMRADLEGIVRCFLVVLLAVSVTTSGTASVYATSVFGPHLKPPLAQSRAVPVRFISPDTMDPTIPGVGTNRYAYAQNDPVNKSDPSGHICVPCGIGLVIGGISALLSSTEPVNAPGPDDEIQDTPEAQILGNMAIGAIPGKPVEQAAIAVGRYFGSRVAVWSMGPATRGFLIEAKLGANLSTAFRTIDSWNARTGGSEHQVDQPEQPGVSRPKEA